jgi:hypothetical protein
LDSLNMLAHPPDADSDSCAYASADAYADACADACADAG